MHDLTFRFAHREDVPVILDLIRELADYEHMLDQVVADPQELARQLFDLGRARVLFPQIDGQIVGFALYFHNFSTFLGRAGLYLEDLYIRPQWRGRGIGKATLRRLAAIAREQGCGRMEWWCLDWNEPSIGFYKKLGAQPMSDWTVYRLTAADLEELAEPVANEGTF